MIGSAAGRVFATLLGLSLLSLSLLELRMLVRGDGKYSFLAWNLFLAWIPLVLAVVAVALWRSDRRISAALPLILWLLFFPNAPYVVTDFVHLHDIGGMPRWFDSLMLGSFALTAVALGFVSLYLIQNLIRDTVGDRWSWLTALTVIGLSGIGIYLGRVYQLNSWNVLQPGKLLAALAARDSAAQEHGALLTLLLTFFLAATYVAGQHLAQRRTRPSR